MNIDHELRDLLSKNQEYKINIALKLLKEIQDNDELILILDNGCIVNFERKFSNWFKQIVESDTLENKITICTASKYKVDFREMIYLTNTNELLNIMFNYFQPTLFIIFNFRFN